MLSRIVNKLVNPLGMQCRKTPNIKPAPELPPGLLEGATILPSRYSLLDELPDGGNVTEVGIGFGYFTQNILTRMNPSHFVAIDTFTLDSPSFIGKRPHQDVVSDVGRAEWHTRRRSCQGQARTSTEPPQEKLSTLLLNVLLSLIFYGFVLIYQGYDCMYL